MSIRGIRITLLILLVVALLLSFFVFYPTPPAQNDLLILEEEKFVKVTFTSFGDALLISVDGVDIEKYYLDWLWKKVTPSTRIVSLG